VRREPFASGLRALFSFFLATDQSGLLLPPDGLPTCAARQAVVLRSRDIGQPGSLFCVDRGSFGRYDYSSLLPQSFLFSARSPVGDRIPQEMSC